MGGWVNAFSVFVCLPYIHGLFEFALQKYVGPFWQPDWVIFFLLSPDVI